MSVETGFATFLISRVARSTALSIPRFRAIGFAPAATAFTPSRKMACASTVAVVVPSPATSLVFAATSRTICAPIFSIASLRSISFATVTPSLVIVGLPYFLSSTTFRPLGPRVTFTVSASLFTPRRIAARECPPKVICFAIIFTCSSRLCRISTPEKVQSKNDDCCYKQQVNQAVSNKASVKPDQPQQQQHYKNCPQHESYLLTSNCLESCCLRLNCANRTVCAVYHIRAILLREVVGVTPSFDMPVSVPATPSQNRLLAALHVDEDRK